MINRRHFLTTVAVGTASAAALAACGTGSSTSAGETGSAENPVTINYTWWGNDDRAERTRKAIALFEEKNPDIKVNGNFTDFAGYWQKRATEAAGGGLPDVMQWDLSYLRDYGQRNQLLDLGTVNINTDAFEKSLLPSGQIKGKTYGIPTSTNAFAVYYDPAKLASLGIAEPDGSGGVDVLYYGRAKAILARQLLLLPAGKYRLAMNVARTDGEAAAIRWTLRCATAGKLLAQLPLRPGPVAGQFVVPAGCTAQWLELEGIAGETPGTSELKLAGLRLTSGQGT